jgi:hypothetical protein
MTSQFSPKVSEILAPDFITFLCHHIAVVEYQQVSYNFWVVLGGASKLLRTFALCIYAKSIIVQVPQVL